MASSPYRVLYNQDCSNIFHITKEPVELRHINKMVDEVAEGGADVMLINPNAQKANYPSKVWQKYWDGYEKGEGGHLVCQMRHLAASGIDYLSTVLARCRHRGIAPGVSIRMNDMHGAPAPDFHTHSQFWLRHPQFRLPYSIEERSWSAKGFNYDCLEVREHYLKLIREIVMGYDLEVLELDFLRFPLYFPLEPVGKYAAVMTDFLRQVRSLIAESGKRIALIPRVASTPAASAELHFDIATWAREGLIEGLTAGMFLSTGWEMPVAEFRDLLGSRVPLYLSTDMGADKRGNLPRRMLPLEPELLRGLAAGYLAAGADGLNLFNFFCARESHWIAETKDPRFDVLGQIKSLEDLRRQPRTHLISCGGSRNPSTDLPGQIPLASNPRWASRFTILLAKPPADYRVEAAFLLQSELVKWPQETDRRSAHVPANRLWLHVNTTACGSAAAVEMGPVPPAGKDPETGWDNHPNLPFYWVRFDVPVSALRDGPNSLVFRNEFCSATIMGLEVRIQPPWPDKAEAITQIAP